MTKGKRDIINSLKEGYTIGDPCKVTTGRKVRWMHLQEGAGEPHPLVGGDESELTRNI